MEILLYRVSWHLFLYQSCFEQHWRYCFHKSSPSGGLQARLIPGREGVEGIEMTKEAMSEDSQMC